MTQTNRQRVIDHGEVLTPPNLVCDMLDLPGVADECTRIDARFLEPACGNGNFLAEIFRLRLDRVSQMHPKAQQHPWERDALVGLSNLYGIELLPDNVQACRDRLHGLFEDAYIARFASKHQPAILGAARHIVTANIVLASDSMGPCARSAIGMRTSNCHLPDAVLAWPSMTGSTLGTYALILHLPVDTELTVGRLGNHTFPAGWYVYAGSARGPGGVQARVKRHLRATGRPHKHIDYLRDVAEIVDVWATHDPKFTEHHVVELLMGAEGASVPAKGFGSSDCTAGCEAHLVRFAGRAELLAHGEWW